MSVLLKNFKLDGSVITYEDSEEDVISGLVVGEVAENRVQAENQVAAMVNYNQENTDDDANAFSIARDVKIPFNTSDIKLWFSLIESKLQFAGIKKQWSKRQVLIQLIPPEFHIEFKSYLQLQETEVGDTQYFTLKKAMVKRFGPRRADNFDRAIARVMMDLPSTLGKEILNDICPSHQPLTRCHCTDLVLGIWRRSLSQVVRNQIADMEFDGTTYNAIFDKADSVWVSNSATTTVVLALASMSSPLEEATEVATILKKGKNKNKNGKSRNGGGGNGNNSGGSKGQSGSG